jgi:hypothetical protein
MVDTDQSGSTIATRIGPSIGSSLRQQLVVDELQLNFIDVQFPVGNISYKNEGRYVKRWINRLLVGY